MSGVTEVGICEVQTALISAEIWPVIWNRLDKSDRRSIWGLDWFWSEVAKKMHNLGIAAPPLTTPRISVSHMDFRSMDEEDLGCQRRCIDGCEALNNDELSQVLALLEYSQFKFDGYHYQQPIGPANREEEP